MEKPCAGISIQDVDTFCGTGGLMHGVRLAGIDVKAKFDNGTVGVTKSGSKQIVEV